MERRIVVIGGGWSEGGGISNRTRLVAREFARRGWNVTVFGRAGTRHLFQVNRQPRIWALDVPGFRRPAIGAPLFVATVVTALAGLAGLRRIRPVGGIVCFQLSSPLTAGALGGLLLNAPVVASTTSSGEFSEVTYLQTRRSAAVRRWTARRAAFLVGQTEEAAKELRELTTEHRVAILPTPVDVRPDVFPLPNRGRVAYIGRLSEEKHLPELLEAWRGVAVERPIARLYLVGAGGAYRSIEDDLRARVAHDDVLSKSVELTGHIDDVRSFLRTVDIFVLPSRTEGMSNALLEAAAEGRAVIASRIPGNVAVLGERYPHYVAPGSVEELRHELLRLLQDPALAAESALAARSAAEDHAIERVVDRLLELLRASSP